ncbi:snoRNA-binding rRNA-processing protein [Blyttiomyces sp. JEL0837]|nr:snoRNA-binding rRNA-processing protein [Blyttiomyces sp. JEL0837]
MSQDYKKIAIKKFPTAVGKNSAEANYWKKFKSPILVKEYASVTSINFSAAHPHDFAVTSSTRDVAFSGSIRNDGKLLVAGDAGGTVQVFDMGSRAILRTLSGHKDSVRLTKFSPNYSHILSGSDDSTLRIWDMTSETPVALFEEHTDHVRAGCVSTENPHVVMSGSYDHTVKLWDIRAQKCMLTMKHGNPVEGVMFLPGSSLAASIGGNKLKIWNLLDGGSLFQSLSNHQKTITCMSLDGSGTRILTGSLDQQVKIYSLENYRVTHSIKYTAPILSLGVSPSDTHLVVGMTSGLLSIRQRVVKTEDVVKAQRKVEAISGGSMKYFTRGLNHKAEQSDILVEAKKKNSLKRYDRLLQKFQYGQALDMVLETKQNPVVVVSLLEDLVHRNGLRIALGGRDDIALEAVTRFVVRHISNPKYATLLIHVTNVILDMYQPVIGQSTIIDELFMKLRRRVQEELDCQQNFLKCIGFLESLMISSQAPQ